MFYNKTVTENGLTILSENMPNVRSVSIGIWVGLGSRDEPKGISGVSHFLEHMMFKGTKTRTSRDISEEFEGMGAELNAFTSKELTSYYARLLDEHLPKGIEILSDMLQNSTFEEKEINAEKHVVLEEISMHEDSPDEIIHDLFSENIFRDHPLGKRILGNTKTVGAFNNEKIVDFYDKAYIPKNIIIAAAGSVEHEALVGLAEQYFKKEDGGTYERSKVEAQPGSRLVVKKKDSEQAYICLGSLSLSATHKDRFVLSVLDNILGGGMSSRLFQEIREKRGMAYSVFSYHSVHAETGSMCLYAGTAPKNVGEVIKIMKDEIQKLIDKDVSDAELKRAKEHIKGQLVLGLESTAHRMMRLGKSALSQGKIYSVDELIEKIDIVTKEDIKKLAAELLAQNRQCLSVIGPIGEEVFSSYNFKDKEFI